MRLMPAYLGLSLVAMLWLVGIAWPLTEGYPSALHWLGDRIIEAKAPRFDRDRLRRDLAGSGFVLGDEAHVRIFKREKRLELWMRRAGAGFALFRSYGICTYSGELGPKLKEGDRQAPEGFYRVGRGQLNPNSRHHLAFNLGFPNAYDSQHGRTGSFLMVHGGCSSIGCYAITDESVDEVYAVLEAALGRGQPAVDVHVFPFRLTATALAREGSSAWLGFWRNLKEGHDLFEAQKVPPRVAACRGAYVFGSDAEGAECVAIAAWS